MITVPTLGLIPAPRTFRSSFPDVHCTAKLRAWGSTIHHWGGEVHVNPWYMYVDTGRGPQCRVLPEGGMARVHSRKDSHRDKYAWHQIHLLARVVH